MIDEVTQRRIAALREYEIMDTPPEEEFDEITRLTSFICGTPMALVTLLDHRRQWFKSKVGISGEETPIEHAFCAHAIKQEGVMLVNDATQDARFAANPLVTSAPNIRFYAGAPLVTREGVALGTLCAVDCTPREFGVEKQEALMALAHQVIRSLELRKTVKALELALLAKERAQQEVLALQALLPMCSWCRKIRDDSNYWCQVEDYFSQHSQIRFSHGVCPDCFDRLQKELEGGAEPRG